MIGKRLGSYEIVEEIGKGGMATVYRAYHPSVDRFVAVKVILRGIASDEGGLERFKREARLITKLEHPHILPVYDYNGDNDPPYIIMRYLEGGTLKDIFDNKPLPLNEVAHMIRQIASALDYAHREGIIHRDIKPSNIMVDKDGNAFLTDFGIARINETGDSKKGLTQTGFAMGTPGYMAPEQGIGSQVDARADIYALGVMLFEMATGHSPYEAETPMAIVMKHIQDPIPSAYDLNPELPRQIDEIIKKAMAKNPDERYSNASDLATDVSRLVDISAFSTRPVKLSQAARESIKSIHARREVNKTELETILKSFAELRGTQSLPDIKTVLTPSQPVAAANPPPPATPSRKPLILGGLGTLVVVILAAMFLLRPSALSDPEQTATARTGTETAIAALPTITETSTATHTDTPTDTPTLTPSSTNTPAAASLQAQRDIPVRVERDINSEIIETISQGDSVEIVTLTFDNRWYQIRLPDGREGWVQYSALYTSIDGNIQAVAILPTETSTSTSTYTPTSTATPTNTATATKTWTPTATHTLSKTPTSSHTPTPSATHTATQTVTPSNTPTATWTPTSTYTPTDTATPTPSLTPTHTLTPTLTPTASPGRLPYMATFEDASSLTGWNISDSDGWRIESIEGRGVLVGQTRLENGVTVIGDGQPEWLNADVDSLVIRYSFNIEATEGARLIFGYEPNEGYNVLEMLPGALFLKRNGPSANIVDRDNEIRVARVSANIDLGEWHDITVWLGDGHITIYLDDELLISREDAYLPEDSAGQIVLQVMSSFRTVSFDNLVIQRPFEGSIHFDRTSRPSAYSGDINLSRESDENGYLLLRRAASVKLEIPPLRDLSLSARIWSEEGGYQIFLRENEQGSLKLDLKDGNLDIIIIDGAGDETTLQSIRNVYGRGEWQNVHIKVVDQELTVTVNGEIRAEEKLENTDHVGTLRFAVVGRDSVRIDDVLIIEEN